MKSHRDLNGPTVKPSPSPLLKPFGPGEAKGWGREGSPAGFLIKDVQSKFILHFSPDEMLMPGLAVLARKRQYSAQIRALPRERYVKWFCQKFSLSMSRTFCKVLKGFGVWLERGIASVAGVLNKQRSSPCRPAWGLPRSIGH